MEVDQGYTSILLSRQRLDLGIQKYPEVSNIQRSSVSYLYKTNQPALIHTGLRTPNLTHALNKINFSSQHQTILSLTAIVMSTSNNLILSEQNKIIQLTIS